jgi:putative ABC transport system permease protein
VKKSDRLHDDDLPLSGARPVDDDVRGELEFHLQQRIADLMARGRTREQAASEARASFGDRAAVEAECRQIESRRRTHKQRADRFEALWQDIRLGARVLRKSPGFTISAILTLALGIGANAAVFSIVNGVILQPLAYEHADRLVTLYERNEKGGAAPIPWLNFVDLQSQSHSFEGLASYGTGITTVIVNGAATRVNAGPFTEGFFKVFPLKPVMGRLPTDAERTLGANPVAVVSYAFWRDRLGAPASLDTVHIMLDKPTSVIGVLPNGFDFPDGNQIYLVMEREPQTQSRTAHNWEVIGRLRAGVTVADAEREAVGIYARLNALYAPAFGGVGAQITPLQAQMTGALKTPLYLLLAASTVLLLGACVNLASAMLARGTARASEFAVRSALGATRVRLVRQLFTESALLALLGCGAGLALAAVLLKILAFFAPASLHVERVHVDLWVQGFALTVAGLTAVLFGLLPALRIADTNGATAMREASRGGTAGSKRMRAWNVLVAAEIALAVVLLSGSALLIRSFANVMETKIGFEPTNVYTVALELPRINYPDSSPTIAAFHEQALARLGHLSGVQAVGFANMLPLAGNYPNGGLLVEGKPLDPTGQLTSYSVYRVVGGDYFTAMNIPIIKGRALRETDAKLAAPGVVVSEEWVKQEYPNGEDPIGRRMQVVGMDRTGTLEPWYTIVGVAGNVRGQTVTGPYRATNYFDFRTRPSYRSMRANYVVKSALPSSVIAPMIRREIAAIDHEVPVDIKTMNDLVTQTVADRRFTMLALGAFAFVALLLAVVGIYAVVSYAVAQRTREIGVRLALGATAGQVRGLVLTSAMRAVVPGLVVGGALAAGTAQALRTMLYGVTPFDLAALAAAIGLLGFAAVVSSLLPALRATRVDPLTAMRAE